MDNCLPRDRIPLNFGIAFFAPISSVAGSATLQITQPLFVGNVCYAPLLIALAEVFLLIANYVFRLESVPVIDVGLGRRIQMPIGELRSLLNIAAANSSNRPSSRAGNQGLSTPGDRGFLTIEEPSAPLLIGLSIFSDYTLRTDSPSTQFIVPIVEVSGLRGALPMIILALLFTIFVRAVVSPQASGARPSNSSNSPTINLTPETLMQILKRFGKYFPSN